MPAPEQVLADIFGFIREKMPRPFEEVERRLDTLLGVLQQGIQSGRDIAHVYRELRELVDREPYAAELLRDVLNETHPRLEFEIDAQFGAAIRETLAGSPPEQVMEQVEQAGVKKPVERVLEKEPEEREAPERAPAVRGPVGRALGELPPPPIDVGTRPVTPIEHHGGRDLGEAPPFTPGGEIGGRPAKEATAQVKERREQEQRRLNQAVSEAGERLETPVSRARRVVQEGHRISEETGAPLSEPVVRLEAMLMVREETEREQGIPTGYEPGRDVSQTPASMFVQDPTARAGLEARERAERGFDPERLARAEQGYRETIGALSRGIGARGGMSGEFDIPAYTERLEAATGLTMAERAKWAREHRPGTAERKRRRGKKAPQRGPRSSLYTSPTPLEMALRR